MSLLNRSAVRERAMRYAADTRAHRFQRVSKNFLDALETDLDLSLRLRVKTHPSKGKTLQG